MAEGRKNRNVDERRQRIEESAKLGKSRRIVFFFQAKDDIRDLVRSRGLGDVYKRQVSSTAMNNGPFNPP